MTSIAELLAADRTWSFEFSPPRTEAGQRAFDAAVSSLAALEPSFVSITYGAMGSTRDTTRDLVLRVDTENRFPAMPHLTCIGHTTAEIQDLIESYHRGGVRNILALGGDPPADGSDVTGDFTYATELIDLIRRIDPSLAIGVAAFPELHPRSPDRATDRRFLAEKLAHADFGITQFFFATEPYRRMVEELGELDCVTPVMPGVMPFISVTGLRRMAAINGTAIPADLDRHLDAVDGDPEATRRLGVAVAADLVAELLDLDVPGIHLYAMNKARSIEEIYDRLGLRTPL